MAQTDFHLKIEGVEGEDTHDKHKGEVEILSWGWEASNGAYGTGTGSGTGKVAIRDMRFTTHVGKHSAKLALSCCSLQHFPSATLTCRRSGGDSNDYLVYKLTHVTCTNYQCGGSGSDMVPVDSFTLNCKVIEFEYKVQGDDGNPTPAGKMGWNIAENKPV